MLCAVVKYSSAYFNSQDETREMMQRNCLKLAAAGAARPFDPYSASANQRASIERVQQERQRFETPKKQTSIKEQLVDLWYPNFTPRDFHENPKTVLQWRDYRGPKFYKLLAWCVVCQLATTGSWLWGLYFADQALLFKDEPWSPF